MILARKPRIPLEAPTGISAPDRNICGKISSGTPTATTFGILGEADEEDAERAAGEGQDRRQRDDPEQVARRPSGSA